MLRTLVLSAGLLAAAACSERVVVEAPAAKAVPAIWVSPDLALALPLPHGWEVQSSFGFKDLPIYGGDLIHGRTQTICRLALTDFRNPESLVIKKFPDLSPGEVSEMVHATNEAVSELWQLEGFREAMSEYDAICDCDGKTVGVIEAFKGRYLSDTEAEASWQVRFDFPDRPRAYVFHSSNRTLRDNRLIGLSCAYTSYADRAQNATRDLAELRAAVDF